MRKKSTLIERFFQAAEESDEAFFKALNELMQSTKAQPQLSTTSDGANTDLMKTVRETTGLYGDSASLDNAPFTVGEAMRQMLKVNGWTVPQAAKRLGVSDEVMKNLFEEMMPLSSGTVPGVAKFFSTEYRIANPQTLREWLITGLRFLEMQSSQPSSLRHAARRKKE
jgi:hypothetical protein